MEYIVLGKDGQEYGPVDPETLKKWVEHGRVFKDSQIRNSLMQKWNEAGTMDILQDAFAVQQVHEEDEEGVSDKLMGMFGLGKKEHKVTEEKEVQTAFKQRYIPSPATAGQRIGAFVIDGFLIACFGIILFLVMNISAGTLGIGDWSLGSDMPTEVMTEDKDKISTEDTTTDGEAAVEKTTKTAEEEVEEVGPFVATDEIKAKVKTLNQSIKTYFFIFATVVLLYYGIALGVYAQTYGMYFWGILIVKGYDAEVFPARATAFTVAMFAIGIITPIIVLLNPQHRSIHGYLTGTRLIRVAAKPKA